MNTQNNSTPFIDVLNPAQKQAVTAPFGAQLVIAGAGSGKTRVITSRIAYLMSHHSVPASAILALTFTNKAGNEMKHRIKQLLPDTATPFVGTFHSYCVKLLKQFSSYLPYPDFTIVDADDQRAILKKIMVSFGVDKHITPAKMHGLISLSKNHLPGSFDTDIPHAPFFNEVKSAYEEAKAQSHAYDFDDLLLVTLELLTKHPEVQKRIQDKVKHLLVDEYQDTNQVQHALLKKIACNAEGKSVLDSICAVGDQDQSIYSWRGAQADNMQRFVDDFAPVTTVAIEQNYRSVQPILEAANAVITNNNNRHEKKLWSARSASDRILSLYCQSAGQEAQSIAQTIQLISKKVPLSETAVLYRTHHQSRSIEEALMLAGIAYRIYGGIRFYERKEIKDILAYLKLTVNPHDRQSFYRIVNTPTRGIGDKCLSHITAQWEAHPDWSCMQLLDHLLTSGEVSFNKQQREGLLVLQTLFNDITNTPSLGQKVELIIARISYREHLKKENCDNEYTAKNENLNEFISAIGQFESEHDNGTLADFLEHVLLMQEQTSGNGDEQPEQVSLMTLHASKGLEFSFVALCGLEEDVFPSSRTLHSIRELEEERRLLYVGLTRAKEWVLITHSQLRATFGSVTEQTPSRFLTEIPTTHHTAVDARSFGNQKRVKLIAQWLGITDIPFTPSFHVPDNQTGNSIINRKKSFNLKGRSEKPKVVASAPVAQPNRPWKVRMPVKHQVFGIGIIQAVEPRSDSEYFLTISFKKGTKKLSSKFVARV
jgi:DNA helicase-2/ATP-dependent DNA helicase PcrA